MTNVNPNIAWACGTLLLLAVVAAVATLAWHGTIAGGAVVAILTAIVGIAGGIIGVHAGVSASAKNAVTQALVLRERLTQPPS